MQAYFENAFIGRRLVEKDFIVLLDFIFYSRGGRIFEIIPTIILTQLAGVTIMIFLLSLFLSS